MFLLPDAELELINLIRPALATAGWSGTTVTNTVPRPRLPQMVIVRRDGGNSPDIARDLARMSVQVWARTEKDCADLAAVVRALLRDTLGQGPVRKVEELSGPTRIADQSGQPLMYLVYEITLRGEEVA